MRISYWSSDVCSSDLLASSTTITYQPSAGYTGADSFTYTASNTAGTSAPATVSITVSAPTLSLSPAAGALTANYGVAYSQVFAASGRSEEHTSELQSLMRISYAVFCLKKQTKSHKHTQI